MTPGRGIKNPPPEPPSSASSKDADFGWDEAGEEDLFDRPTLIPDVLPTEAALMEPRPGALLPTPVPSAPPVDDYEWEQSSLIVRKNPAPELPKAPAPQGSAPGGPVSERRNPAPSAGGLEFDLDDLGPPSVDLKVRPAAPRGPGKAKPISLSNMAAVPRPGAPASSPPAPPAPPVPPAPSPAARSVPSPAPRSSPLASQPTPVPSARPVSSARNVPPAAAKAPAESRNTKITTPNSFPMRPVARPEPNPLDRWGAEPPRSPAIPPAESDPLALDLYEDLSSQERVDLADDDLGFDFEALRHPKMAPPASRPTPRSAPPSFEHEPHTAPYPIDDDRSSFGGRYVAPQLRQPPPVAPATTPLESSRGTLESSRGTLESSRGTLESSRGVPDETPPPRRAPLMGEPSRRNESSLNPQERLGREMRDKFALGDFSGSLKAAEALLELDSSSPEAGRYAENCRLRLRSMFEAKFGSLQKVPRIILPPDQVRWLSLDHRAGFILSCVDGYSCIEEILDVSGMAPLDALRILSELLQQKVIAVP